MPVITVCRCNRIQGGPQQKQIIILNNGNSPYWDACRTVFKEAEKDLALEKAGYKASFVDNDGAPQGQIDKLRQYASQSDVVAVGLVAIDASNAAIVDEMHSEKERCACRHHHRLGCRPREIPRRPLCLSWN